MAQDLKLKRQVIAANGVKQSIAFIDALNALVALKEEKTRAGINFEDADFIAQGLQHLTPYLVGLLFDIVIPHIQTSLEAQDLNVLYQMKS